MKKLSILLIAIVCSLSAVNGATLVTYNFTMTGSGDTTAPASPSYLDANITSSSLTPILNGSASTSTDKKNGMAISIDNGNAWLGYKAIDNIAGDDYWSLKITPKVGELIDFTSVSFDWGSPKWTGAKTVTWDLKYSINGSSDISLGVVNSNISESSGNSTISTPLLTGIGNSVIEFKIYNYQNTDSILTNGEMSIDNIVIEGAAVPEPLASLSVVGVSLIGFGAWRRFQKNKA